MLLQKDIEKKKSTVVNLLVSISLFIWHILCNLWPLKALYNNCSTFTSWCTHSTTYGVVMHSSNTLSLAQGHRDRSWRSFANLHYLLSQIHYKSKIVYSCARESVWPINSDIKVLLLCCLTCVCDVCVLQLWTSDGEGSVQWRCWREPAAPHNRCSAQTLRSNTNHYFIIGAFREFIYMCVQF